MSSANEVLYQFQITDRIQDSCREATVYFKTPLAPTAYRTGQPFDITLNDPTLPDGLNVFKGIVESVERDDTDNNRIYSIYGRHIGRMLDAQPFKYDCTKPENSTSKTVLELINLILTDTGIMIGRGMTLDQTIKLNTTTDDLNRFCGSWDTKREALNQLFSQYVKLSGASKFRWYVNTAGYLCWFETRTTRMGYDYIFKDTNNIVTFKVKEDATTVVNRITGNAGTDNNITVTLNDTDSQSKYRIRVGPDISESDMTQAQLTAAVQTELDQKSGPIYTVEGARFRGFYDWEPGMQVIFPEDPYYPDMVFTVTDRNYYGSTDEMYSEFNLSTDQTVVSVVNEFDTVRAAAEAAANKVKSQTGTAVADAASGRVLIYVNETGTVENVRSP